MKNKKLLAISIFTILTAVLLPGFFPAGAEMTEGAVQTLKIGLFYGDNALPSANLQNYTGSGFMFGFYDSNGSFNYLGETEETKITMMKDWNMYISGGAYYDEAPDSYAGVVGCYHIRLPGVYGSFQEAGQAAMAYENAFPAYFNGLWNVCVGNYTSYSEAESANSAYGLGGEPMTASQYCITVTVTGTNKILFEYDCGSGTGLAVVPKPVVDEKPETWFKGYRYNGGFQYLRLTGKDLTVINFVDIEDYVKGVVPYEMDPSWPMEALKAQALCARTYAASHIGLHKSYGFDLCNTTCCQVYQGQNRANEISNSAVDATAGKFILYDGQYCKTFFHSSNGGATEDCENVFHESLPYIRGVQDNYEKTVNTGYSSWSFTYTAEDITWILQNKGYKCGNIVSITPTYTALGNIYSLKFTDDNGKNWTFSKYDASCILYSSTLKKYTYSMRFKIETPGGSGTVICVNSANNPIEDPGTLYAIGSGEEIAALGGRGEVTVLTGSGLEDIRISGGSSTLSADSYIVSGSGWGHNVGMSQFGAKAMANLGYTYEDIIRFYYTGVTIG